MRSGRIATTIKNNAGKYLKKGVGLGALGLVGYESHYIGKMQSDRYATEKDALATSYYLNNTMYNESLSPVRQGIKQAAYEMELEQGWRRFFNLGIGYVKGFGSMLISNVIPLGLGLTTLLAKGKTSTISAIALGIYAAGSVIKNFFGLGVPKGPLE